MIRSIWNFIAEPKNLAVLGVIGGAIAFLWKIAEPYINSPDQAETSEQQTQVVSESGAESAVDPATESLNRSGASASADESGSAENKPEQRAEASGGGTAVNAGDNATITIVR